MYILLNSTKRDGNTSLVYGERKKVLENRKNFFLKNNIDIKNTLVLKAQNENIIKVIDKEFLSNYVDLSEEVLDADAVITKEKNIFCYLNFGDCVPLVIYDKRNEVMAFCHLGWHSINNNLHIETINKLVNEYGSKVEDLICEIGPSIKKDSYINKKPIQLGRKDWEDYIEKIDEDNYKVDLCGYVVNTLENLGIKDIKVSNIDTYLDNNYFSHYKEEKFNLEEKGRFIVGAMLK